MASFSYAAASFADFCRPFPGALHGVDDLRRCASSQVRRRLTDPASDPVSSPASTEISGEESPLPPRSPWVVGDRAGTAQVAQVPGPGVSGRRRSRFAPVGGATPGRVRAPSRQRQLSRSRRDRSRSEGRPALTRQPVPSARLPHPPAPLPAASWSAALYGAQTATDDSWPQMARGVLCRGGSAKCPDLPTMLAMPA